MKIVRRLGFRGVLAGCMLVVTIVVAVPLLASGSVRCRTFGEGCPRQATPARPEAPPQRLTLTAEQVANTGTYVALGDSYSSGEGAYVLPTDTGVGNRCHRTSQSYYFAVSKSFPFAGGSQFWACSGARTAHLLHDRKGGEPPQLDQVDAGTSLVTLSIGGNDLGFTRVLSGCILPAPWSDGCQGQDAEVAARMPALRHALNTIADRLVKRAPKARIILLGYPRLFSERQSEAFDNLSVEDQQWLNRKGLALNQLIREVAQSADARVVAAAGQGSVEFIDVYGAFTGHEIGTSAPYVNGLDVDLSAFKVEFRSFHPNAAGYAALSQLVNTQIKQGHGRPLNQWPSPN
jgi:lysophospholipase L1-like esterase